MSDTLFRHAAILCASYQRLTGRILVECPAPQALAALNAASFVVVSHGLEADPVFNYGNQAALNLFEMNWDEFTKLPSRLSAEAIEREARARLLVRVMLNGYVDDYSGVRISAKGKRFMVKNATIWNLTDETGAYYGQAALLKNWEFI